MGKFKDAIEQHGAIRARLDDDDKKAFNHSVGSSSANIEKDYGKVVMKEEYGYVNATCVDYGFFENRKGEDMVKLTFEIKGLPNCPEDKPDLEEALVGEKFEMVLSFKVKFIWIHFYKALGYDVPNGEEILLNPAWFLNRTGCMLVGQKQVGPNTYQNLLDFYEYSELPNPLTPDKFPPEEVGGGEAEPEEESAPRSNNTPF